VAGRLARCVCAEEKGNNARGDQGKQLEATGVF
jgi:hypothetical protein